MDYAIEPLDDPWLLRRPRTETVSWRPPLYAYPNVLRMHQWQAEINRHGPRRVERADISSFAHKSLDRSALEILGFNKDDGQYSIVEDVDYTKHHERPGDWKELCHLITLPALENHELNYYVPHEPSRGLSDHYWSQTQAKRDWELLLEYFMKMNHIQEPSQLLPFDARAALFYDPPGLMVHLADYQERHTEYAQRANPRTPKLPSPFYSRDREQNTLPGLYFGIFYLKKAKKDGNRLQFQITEVQAASICNTHDNIWFIRMPESEIPRMLLGNDNLYLSPLDLELKTLVAITNLRFLFRLCTLATRGWIRLVEQAVFNLWDPTDVVTIKGSDVEFYLRQNIRTLGMVRAWVLRNHKSAGKDEEPLSAEYVQVINMFDSKIPEMISNLELLLGSAIASRKDAGDGSTQRMLRLSTNQLQLGFVSQNAISSATTLILIFTPLIFVSTLFSTDIIHFYPDGDVFSRAALSRWLQVSLPLCVCTFLTVFVSTRLATEGTEFFPRVLGMFGREWFRRTEGSAGRSVYGTEGS